MTLFATYKPKPSLFLASKRISGLMIFSGMMLLFYRLFSQHFPSHPHKGLPHDSVKQRLPSAPVAEQVTEERGTLLGIIADHLNFDERRSDEDSGDPKAEKPHSDTEEAARARKTEFEPGCLRKVIYDKPVKTGSTAITFAIREYLYDTGRIDLKCDQKGESSCAKQVERICLGIHEHQSEEPSFIGHLHRTNGSTIECLKKMGYYAVTSIRDPYQRRKSAYLYNKTTKGNHFSIPHTASFKEFMERLPRCSLLNFYDGLGSECDVGVKIDERVRRIVDRYDEVIELGEEPKGKLFKKILRYVTRENESEKEEVRETFDEETLREEAMLYNAMKEKMGSGGSDRAPC